MFIFMKPNELKQLRKKVGVRQKDMAAILEVPFRTYQNWEQQPEKKEHRKIPVEFADKVRVLAEFKGESTAPVSIPHNLTWLQVPLLETELRDLELRADLEEKNLSMLIREKIIELLQSPLP